MSKFIFDTNIYNQILLRKISTEFIRSKGELYTTNVQLSEIKNNPNRELKDKILAIFTELKPIRLNLDSGVWLDDLYWDDEQPWRDEIGKTAKLIFSNSKKAKMWKDALIGEVAKNNSLTLVTNDRDFVKRRSLSVFQQFHLMSF